LREIQSRQAITLLTPLLEDKQNTGWSSVINPQKDGLGLPIRVGDEAAETIAMQSKKITFVLEGSYENCNRQIETIRRQIGEVKPSK
jgi:hypothetical protein